MTLSCELWKGRRHKLVQVVCNSIGKVVNINNSKMGFSRKRNKIIVTKKTLRNQEKKVKKLKKQLEKYDDFYKRR